MDLTPDTGTSIGNTRREVSKALLMEFRSTGGDVVVKSVFMGLPIANMAARSLLKSRDRYLGGDLSELILLLDLPG